MLTKRPMFAIYFKKSMLRWIFYEYYALVCENLLVAKHKEIFVVV